MKRNRHILVASLSALTIMLCSGAVASEPEPSMIGPAEFYWLLNQACTHGDALSVRMLLDAGADPNGYQDYAAFHTSSYQFGVEPSWPLNQATTYGHAEIVKILLEAGAKPDTPEGEGMTALTIAAEAGNQAIVSLLLAAGASRDHVAYPRSQEYSRGTAEELARQAGHEELANMIRDFGDDD